MISDQILRLETDREAPSRVSLLQRAAVSPAPVELYPYRNMVFASLAGLLLPFGLVVVWEGVYRRVGDAGLLERQSDLAVVGEIARLPLRARVSRISASARLKRSLRMFEESVDSLRTHLVLSEDLRDAKVLAITSAIRHEGKTSVAAQLR